MSLIEIRVPATQKPRERKKQGLFKLKPLEPLADTATLREVVKQVQKLTERQNDLLAYLQSEAKEDKRHDGHS